jgi:hypothetical protein
MKITTIIPTLCEPARRVQLLSAIASIHASSTESVRILVIINGQRFDIDLVRQLRNRDDLEVIQISEGSQTRAHLAGRGAVDTEFFSFLDDDDEYLPGGLDVRLTLMQADPSAAVAVTNGYLCPSGAERLLYSRLRNVAGNPLFELFQQNWLHNCNHLFRTDDIHIGYFEDPHPYMEWTWLAFRLAMEGKSVATSDIPTFRYYDTPGSLSKSTMFLSSRVALYDRMLAANPPRKIADIIRRRTSSAWHDISVAELAMGESLKAMSAHKNSMTAHWSGLKFASFSRRLLGFKGA